MKKIACNVALVGLMAGTLTQGGDFTSRPEAIPQADGVISLTAASATLHSSRTGGISYRGGNWNRIGNWHSKTETVTWTLPIARPGTYAVTAELAAARNSRLTLSLGDETLPCSIPATGGYKDYQPIWIGMITVENPGEYQLRLTPDSKLWKPVNLRALTLWPDSATVASAGP